MFERDIYCIDSKTKIKKKYLHKMKFEYNRFKRETFQTIPCPASFFFFLKEFLHAEKNTGEYKKDSASLF